MKAACIQMRSGIVRAKNLTDASALIARAAGEGAQLILTPEMTNVLDRNPKRLFASLPTQDKLEEVEQFSELARVHAIHLVIGSMAVALGDGRAANRCFIFGPDGSLLCTYDKLHMFDVDLPNGESWKESRLYVAGEETLCVHTDLGMLGPTICYDLRFPGLYRSLAQAGAEILLVPAAFTYQTGEAHWEVLLRARAIETGSFVMAAAQGGEHEDGRKTWGHSMIIDPWGRVLDCKDDTDPGLLLVDLDLAEVARIRQQIPNLGLERDFTVEHIAKRKQPLANT